jgi:hypothetical protein
MGDIARRSLATVMLLSHGISNISVQKEHHQGLIFLMKLTSVTPL